MQAPDPMPEGSLTSEPDRFSDAAWDLLLAGQDQARRWRHGQMDVEHLLQVLFQDPRYEVWVGALPLDRERLLDRLESFCADQPSAPGDDLFIGDALEDLLEAADRRRAAWGSRLLDVPHLLLALLDEPRLGAALLADQGLSEERLLRQLRPGATAAAPERTSRPVRPPLEDDWIDSGSTASGPAAAAPTATIAPAPPGPPGPPFRRSPRPSLPRPRLRASCAWRRSPGPWSSTAATSPPLPVTACSIR